MPKKSRADKRKSIKAKAKTKSLKVSPPAGYRSKSAKVKTDPGTRAKGWEKITKKQPKAKVKKAAPKEKVVKTKAAPKPASSAKKMRRIGRAGPMSLAAGAAAIAPQAIEVLTGPGGVLHRKGKSKKQKPFKATSPMSLTGDVKPRKATAKKKSVVRKKPPAPPAAPKVKKAVSKKASVGYSPMGTGRATPLKVKPITKAKITKKLPIRKPKAPTDSRPRTVAAAQKMGAKHFYDKGGVKKAAVTKEQLKKSGLSLRDYLNKQQGKTRRK